MSGAGQVNCSDQEKTALKSKKEKLASAVETLVSALEVVLENLASKFFSPPSTLN